MSLWAQCPVLPLSLDLNNRFSQFWLWFDCNQQWVLCIPPASQCRNWTRSSYPLLRKTLYIHWRDYTCDHCIRRTLKLLLLDQVSSTTVMKIGSWSSLRSLLSSGVDSNSSSLLAVTRSWDAHYSICMVSQISSSGALLWWNLTVSLLCSSLPFSECLLLELCSVGVLVSLRASEVSRRLNSLKWSNSPSLTSAMATSQFRSYMKVISKWIPY